MKTREEIFDIYLNQYSNDVAVMKISNPFYVPDELSIVKSIDKTGDMYRLVLPEIDLTEDEKDLVIKKSNLFILFIRKRGVLCLVIMNMIIMV